MVTIASFGGGTNSTAMIVRLVNEKKPLDLILFADTGAERPETYCHIDRFSHWLAQRGYPEITIVKKVYRDGTIDTIEGQCLKMKLLPSYAYGFKSCSMRYKIAPQDKYVNNWQPAKDEWKRGEKITKLIGFDAGEEHRVLNAKNGKIDKKYNYEYPLYDWGWDREHCIAALEIAGIKQPGKSSCFFCPAMKKPEIKDLMHRHPKLMQRAIELERNARPNLKTVKGLGRSWSWEAFVKQGQLFPDMFPDPVGSEVCCNCYDG